MEMKAGQCAIAWEATMHGSLPNITSDRLRMAVVARYVPTNAHIYPHQATIEEYGGVAHLENWRAVLVSGRDRCGYNKLLERPA